MKRQVLTLRLKPELIEKIKKDAECSGLPMTTLVTQLILQKYGYEGELKCKN